MQYVTGVAPEGTMQIGLSEKREEEGGQHGWPQGEGGGNGWDVPMGTVGAMGGKGGKGTGCAKPDMLQENVHRKERKGETKGTIGRKRRSEGPRGQQRRHKGRRKRKRIRESKWRKDPEVWKLLGMQGKSLSESVSRSRQRSEGNSGRTLLGG